ncbi:conserved hypothetical protein [Hyella patelloides LEGE 07179]|uniref:Uncharacterized protein n=1 Tax=Hyella patelloides LEGE 07179 TaxID=945734 RepID=A0A563VKN8_9CYAN|nr:hypothetical protein [Hyella patelloides]VEP12009.1 conserved hypothetical protein [Hyella patelloides LEGE 07179]
MNWNRRQLLQVAAATGIGTTLLSQVGRSSSASTGKLPRLTAQADAYAAEVDRGLAYFKEQAIQQLPLVEAWESAITGN